MSNMVKVFRELHNQAEPLKLANAWDAVSAKIVESLGGKAVATTSAGVAWSTGYADGRYMPMEDAVRAAKNIVRVLKVPLTIDFEHGYSDNAKTVGENVKHLLDLGVAGINIEDGPDSPEILAAKIEAIRAAAAQNGQDIFVNARCDVYLAQLVEPGKMVEESIRRGNIYQQAGADGLFLPAISKSEDLKMVSSQVNLPLNAMAWPGLPKAGELGKLGVRRLSAGSAIVQTVWGKTEEMARDFLATGDSDKVNEKYMPHPQLQALFK